jgi:hypothetical protein
MMTTAARYDPALDYEPPFKSLEEAHRMNMHAYEVCPAFRALLDRLWAEGQATAEGWRAAYLRESQMRLPLPEFMPWLRTLGRHPYRVMRVTESPIEKGR